MLNGSKDVRDDNRGADELAFEDHKEEEILGEEKTPIAPPLGMGQGSQDLPLEEDNLPEDGLDQSRISVGREKIQDASIRRRANLGEWTAETEAEGETEKLSAAGKTKEVVFDRLTDIAPDAKAGTGDWDFRRGSGKLGDSAELDVSPLPAADSMSRSLGREVDPSRDGADGEGPADDRVKGGIAEGDMGRSRPLAIGNATPLKEGGFSPGSKEKAQLLELFSAINFPASKAKVLDRIPADADFCPVNGLHIHLREVIAGSRMENFRDAIDLIGVVEEAILKAEVGQAASAGAARAA